MAKSFTVKGLNPATGLVVVVTVRAGSAADARSQVEATGLRFVVVKEEHVSANHAPAEPSPGLRSGQ